MVTVTRCTEQRELLWVGQSLSPTIDSVLGSSEFLLHHIVRNITYTYGAVAPEIEAVAIFYVLYPLVVRREVVTDLEKLKPFR